MLNLPIEMIVLLAVFLMALLGNHRNRDHYPTPVVIMQQHEPVQPISFIISVILLCMLTWIGFCNNSGPSSRSSSRNQAKITLYNPTTDFK